MTLEILATFAGLVSAVTIIVQFTKSVVKKSLGDAAVRLYSFVVALVLTFVFARTGGGAEGILLNIINALIITIASSGAYEILADPKAIKSK